jgi:hypothetical protein
MNKRKAVTAGKVDAIQEAVVNLVDPAWKPKPRAEWSDKEIEWYQDGKATINDYLREKGRL